MQILLQIGKDLLYMNLYDMSGYLLGFGKATACSGCSDVGDAHALRSNMVYLDAHAK